MTTAASFANDYFPFHQLSRRDQFLSARNQAAKAPEQHVAVDPAIAQAQPQNGSVHDGFEFDPTFDWVSGLLILDTLDRHFLPCQYRKRADLSLFLGFMGFLLPGSEPLPSELYMKKQEAHPQSFHRIHSLAYLFPY